MNDTETSARTILRSDELTCPSCIRRIESALDRLQGVSHSKVHFTTGRIEVIHDPERVSPQELVRAVGEAGYRAAPAPF